MSDLTLYATIALSSLAAIAMLTTAALKGWTGWLELKRSELQQQQSRFDAPTGHAGSRIEIADLKERIRKLEAIAAGVEL
ncbi:hypothetical protein [Sphingomonas sp. C3-2]|uniref:hypothetical protein n=1 Tax=Sphingomonas sp. C3-2 TaxID=3062169 RepID=UPI00294B2EA9|nr:hypothetical protein [Sphingomonas sp. C3-2]WOK37047.1 hypothetical protein QYC26_02315 [Sphingomonas sp. C3-2]